MARDFFTQAEDEAVHLLTEALLAYPPSFHRFGNQQALLRPPWPLGGYLLYLGYATPRQIVEALHTQEELHNAGTPQLLGELLVAQGILQPQVLTAVLMVQLLDRHVIQRDTPPRRLGELLVVNEHLPIAELAAALEEQLHLRQAGSWMRLGELLVQRGAIDADLLDAIIAQLQAEPIP